MASYCIPKKQRSSLTSCPECGTKIPKKTGSCPFCRVSLNHSKKDKEE